MADPVLSPDDEDKWDRVGSILTPSTAGIRSAVNDPVIISPENFSNYQFPFGWVFG